MDSEGTEWDKKSKNSTLCSSLLIKECFTPLPSPLGKYLQRGKKVRSMGEFESHFHCDA